MPAGVVDIGQQLLAIGDFEQNGVGGRHCDGVKMGRIARRGDNCRIARPDQRQAEVAEPFFRAEADSDFPLRIEPDAVLLEILRGHFAPQPEDALGGGVAVAFRVAGGLGQLFDDQILRRIGGIAHAKVDHIAARPAFFVHQLVDFGEQIRRQSPHPLGHFNRKRLILDDRFSVRSEFGHGEGSVVGYALA